MATTAGDPLVTAADREFWAFRPPTPVEVPRLAGERQPGHPIDAFVLEKLLPRGLTQVPEADRATLLRRATYDLTGLPPEPAEVEAFLGDTSPDAYERLIDRMLASSRYGERWGRIWLDVAGYADSEGNREQDLPRPHAWRYRDYVICSLNADKPYDRFLLEQLAGDELADYRHAAEITPEIYDNLVATGFLRMAPDVTWANITGYVDERLSVVADEIDVLGSAVMGLTLKCARCHSHKFDPIPQRDYYRVAAVFKGAFDEYDWLKPDIRPGLPEPGHSAGPHAAVRHHRRTTRVGKQQRAHRSCHRRSESRRGTTGRHACAKYIEERIAQLPEVLRATCARCWLRRPTSTMRCKNTWPRSSKRNCASTTRPCCRWMPITRARRKSWIKR